MTFPSRTETVSLLVARTDLEGKSEPPVPWETGRGRWSPNTLPATSLRDRQVPPKPVHCKSKRDLAMDYEGQWQKAGTLESGGRASKVHQETFCSIRAFALCKFAGWPVYETLGLETSLKLRFFFFKGTKQALARSTPSSMALNTVGTENSSFLTHGSVSARGLEGNDDIDCRANVVSIIVDSPRLFLLKKKKKKFEVTTEKRKGKRK